MAEKKSFNDKLMDFVMDKLAGPISKAADNVVVSAIKDGLVGATPVIILGSIFLLLAIVGQPWIGNGGPLIPALSPLTGQFLVAYNLTMNILSLYACIGIAMSYAKHYKMDLLGSALMSLMSFLLITTNVVNDGTISIAPFAASGLFAAIISSIFAVWVYRMCIQKNLVIKMPAGVPQGVGNAFSALIPFVIVAIVTWGLRSIVGFDIISLLSTIMKPLFAATDNIVVFTIRIFLGNILWSVGLHGDNMLNPIITPLLVNWIAENGKAVSEGVDLYHLPHIWTMAVERMSIWTSAAWGLLFWMWRSKVKYVKAMAAACTPAAIFTITEPLIFGLPIVMNPFLLIPFVLSATVSAIVTYGSMAIHLVARPFIELPWATPPPVFAYLATGGDWKAVVVVVVNFLIGVVIYYPFFKTFEKNELEKEKELASEEANAQVE